MPFTKTVETRELEAGGYVRETGVYNAGGDATAVLTVEGPTASGTPNNPPLNGGDFTVGRLVDVEVRSNTALNTINVVNNAPVGGLTSVLLEFSNINDIGTYDIRGKSV